jgi:hypothetical protein
MAEYAKIIAKLPDAEHNGLSPLAGTIMSNPETDVICVVRLRLRKVINDVQEQTRLPQLQIEHIERLEDQDAGAKILLAELESRTGRTPLPFEGDVVLDIIEGDDG